MYFLTNIVKKWLEPKIKNEAHVESQKEYLNSNRKKHISVKSNSNKYKQSQDGLNNMRM